MTIYQSTSLWIEPIWQLFSAMNFRIFLSAGIRNNLIMVLHALMNLLMGLLLMAAGVLHSGLLTASQAEHRHDE